MHETSLVKFTLDAVERKAETLGITRVKDVRVAVGELRGAIPEQMEYAFRILTRNWDLFSEAVLDVEYRPAELTCRKCGTVYGTTLEAFAGSACPACGSTSFEITSGNELLIDSFSGE